MQKDSFGGKAHVCKRWLKLIIAEEPFLLCNFLQKGVAKNNVVEYLASSKMIRQIYGVSGECRLHATGFASNTKNLQNFANTIYRSQHGVRRITCHTVLSVLMDVDGGVEYVRYKEPEDMEGSS